jgi:hypothetical protein
MATRATGWIAGLFSFFVMMWITSYFPEPKQIWVESSSRYHDDSGFQDPLWTGMAFLSILLISIAIGRSVAGVSNRQLKPFIYITIYLGVTAFVADAIVAQLPVVIGTIVGGIMTLGIFYGLYIIWQKFNHEIEGGK